MKLGSRQRKRAGPRSTGALLALLMLAGCGGADGPGPAAAPRDGSSGSPPAFVAASESARVAASSPASHPEEWALAFIDVETTGLVPGWHEMVDLGVVMTDLAGRPLDSLFVRIQPLHPERTSEGARAVNGFDPDRWRSLGAVPPGEAVEALRAFHHQIVDDRPVMLVAFNSQFDAAFLDHLFRGRGASWRELYHYFVLDIPSMAWSLGMRGLTGTTLARALDVADEPHVATDHTGLTGALLNARLYRALADVRIDRAAAQGRDADAAVPGD